MITRTVVCDNLIMGERYSVSYVQGITNPNSAEEVKEDRFPGIYMGLEAPVGYPDSPRCVCCHWKVDNGTHIFLNPLNGGKYRFCQKCLSSAVGFKRMYEHIWDIYTGYWKFEDTDEKKNTVSVLAGTLADMLDWFEIEPELSKELVEKLVKYPREDCKVIQPND